MPCILIYQLYQRSQSLQLQRQLNHLGTQKQRYCQNLSSSSLISEEGDIF
ncbi:hypothetical protein LC608_24585 [Nostoc sp. XA010]|nr:hypothetical protein [Nostoc sp. XA010]MCC5660099.1 hypothetical protein [Nostoc sp. XA010]